MYDTACSCDKQNCCKIQTSHSQRILMLTFELDYSLGTSLDSSLDLLGLLEGDNKAILKARSEERSMDHVWRDAG